MEYLNTYGLIVMVCIMIPNVIFAIKEKNFESKYHNKSVEVIEQIGRFGSMFFMVFNIPFVQYGFWFDNGKMIYIVLTGGLAVAYCFVWFLYFKKPTMSRAMLLAIIPIILFLSAGIIQLHILLIITATLFGVGHIIITYKNNK